MFFNKESGFWEDTTFSACAGNVGDKVLVNAGGPWSSIRVEIVKVEQVAAGRVKVMAKETA